MPSLGVAGRWVLVVEDEYMTATDLAECFVEAGAEVIGPVPSVDQALALIASRPEIDLAVLDVNLGGELVYPVADALVGRQIPMLLVTGYNATAIPTRFKDVAWIQKPVEATAVVRAAGFASHQP